MTFLAELDEALEEAVQAIQENREFAGILFSGEATRQSYLYFLEQTYHYLKHTPSTIRLAAETMKEFSHPVYVMLREALLHHADDEHGHEEWVLNDIRALGGDADAVITSVPNPAVQAYVADAKFTVTSRHPIGVFGEGYILEGLAQRLGVRSVQRLIAHSGIANIERAVSFLQSHGELDEGHLREMRGILQAIENEGDKRAILRRARSTAYQYSHLLHYR